MNTQRSLAETNPWSPANPWGHDPEACSTLDCPGCYAAAYVPPRQTLAEHLDEVYAAVQPNEPYTNADRCEDTEAGRPMDDGSAFYTDDDRRG